METRTKRELDICGSTPVGMFVLLSAPSRACAALARVCLHGGKLSPERGDALELGPHPTRTNEKSAVELESELELRSRSQWKHPLPASIIATRARYLPSLMPKRGLAAISSIQSKPTHPINVFHQELHEQTLRVFSCTRTILWPTSRAPRAE